MPIAALVPVPASLEARDSAPFPLSAETVLIGETDAVARLTAMITARTGLTPAIATANDVASEATGRITLDIAAGGARESYRLDVASDSITLDAGDAAGLTYGLHTLLQLVTRDGDAWTVPAVAIDDAPRFSYRGVMLDVARHFHTVDTVKAHIDRAASLKFNALHLHLTDDQGWRIELHSRPELTAKTSGTSVGGDPGGFYAKADYRTIVEYAARQHMIVVPEIDVPGHTHAVGLAYPELLEEPVLSDHIRDTVRDYGGALPAAGTPYDGMAVGFSSLKIHDEATYDFLADVFGELAGMTPGPYLHLGGDEALGTDPADFAEFVSRASTLIADLGKIPVAWHEAGAAAGLHDETIGQYWGFVTPTDGMDDKARAFVRQGAQLILSPADAIYLDMKHDAEQPLGLVWANGPTSVERSYRWEPSDVIAGIADTDILGIEAPLWSETAVTAHDLDQLAFPRIASAAEAAWSPATGAHPERTWESFRARLGGLAPLWTSLGITYFASPEVDWASE